MPFPGVLGGPLESFMFENLSTGHESEKPCADDKKGSGIAFH